MPFIAKLCAVLTFILLVRCPSVAQQMSARLAELSANCTEGNSLIKSKVRSRVIREGKRSYFSAGIQYDRATTFTEPTDLTIEKQYRIGTPLVVGTRKGRYTFEAGGFFGMRMCRPQQSFWYAKPELVGSSGSSVTPTAALMLGIGADISTQGRLNLQYMHMDNLPDNNVLGRVQLGWHWNW